MNYFKQSHLSWTLSFDKISGVHCTGDMMKLFMFVTCVILVETVNKIFKDLLFLSLNF